MGRWLPNMQRAGPNSSTIDKTQGEICSKRQFMPKTHSMAEMSAQTFVHWLKLLRSPCHWSKPAELRSSGHPAME